MRRIRRKLYTLNDVQKINSTAIRELQRVFLDENSSIESRIRAINSLASLSNSYSRISEMSDLEQRITKLEEK